jgi:hypothetical protein
MKSTRISGRIGARRSASCRPLIRGITTSVSRRWMVAPCFSQARSASPPFAASSTT